MEQIVTAEEMREIERFTMEEIGLSDAVLMERAGMAVCDVIQKQMEEAGNTAASVLIVYGNGNNGADGLVAARLLLEAGFTVAVASACPDKKKSALNERQYAAFLQIAHMYPGAAVLTKPWDTTAGGRKEEMENGTDAKKRTAKESASGAKVASELPREYDVIVDAILGISVNRPLAEDLQEILLWMNQRSGFKLAVDMPTGIDTDSGKLLRQAFRADATVTFGCAKLGQYLGEGTLYCGQIVKAACGMHPAEDMEIKSFLMEERKLAETLARNPLGNKGSFGKIGIIAGSDKICGAALLCAQAAFKSGAGYIRLMTHENNRTPVCESLPEVVLSCYRDGREAEALLSELLQFSKVLAVGCGLGTSEEARLLLASLISCLKAEKAHCPTVLDADALNILAIQPKLLAELVKSGCPIVCTPHMLEFSRMTGKSVKELQIDRTGLAREYAARNNLILVLKDAQTVVASPDGRLYVNTSGNDGMAVAGSGDTLCGMIAALLGQGLEPFDAACIGVYLHGKAGDSAAEKIGKHSMLPTDLIGHICDVMKKYGEK